MNQYMITLLAVLICLSVMLICGIFRKSEWILNLVVRSVVGMLAIYFINVLLYSWGVSSCVGINAATFLTTGILGIPGFLALYVLGFYGQL